MIRCPYCNHTVETVSEEVAHMEDRHSDILAAREASGLTHRDRRDPKREPFLLIRTPITGTRKEAIAAVGKILLYRYPATASYSGVATEIVDALTRVRD